MFGTPRQAAKGLSVDQDACVLIFAGWGPGDDPRPLNGVWA
jgi:hypothetical protein